MPWWLITACSIVLPDFARFLKLHFWTALCLRKGAAAERNRSAVETGKPAVCLAQWKSGAWIYGPIVADDNLGLRPFFRDEWKNL